MLPDDSYTIYIEKRLEKSLEKLPQDIRGVFNQKLEYFRNNHKHPSLNTKPYKVSEKTLKSLGIDEVYEFYINRKDYRCIFYVTHSNKEIIIAFVGNHTQIKNKLN